MPVFHGYIDPDRVPTVTFNLFSANILEHYIERVDELRGVLTDGCQEFVEGLPITQKTTDANPVAKLELIANDGIEGGMQRPGTSFLVLKSNFYGYMFLGNGRWRRCQDCVSFGVHGSQSAGFNTAYGNFQMKTFGLGTIISAFSILNADKPDEWQNSFRQLVFIFLEAARFERVQSYVSGVIERAVNYENLYHHFEPVDAITRRCVSLWKKLSVPLQNYFRPMDNQQAVWSLEQRVIDELNLPKIESNLLPHVEHQQEQAQIQAALAFLRVILRRI